MAVQRFYYGEAITDFLTKTDNTIIGFLTRASEHDINYETTNSWVDEIKLMQAILMDYDKHGSIYFEYNIPRMGRRADVIVLIDSIVFVLEFKTSGQNFTREAEMQVWDYAIDLKNFQEGSRNRIIIPILVAPNESDQECNLEISPFEDSVYNPLRSNAKLLKKCIELCLEEVKVHMKSTMQIEDYLWAISGYDPTPTIIEAAVALYEHHTVQEITRHDGEIDNTSEAIRNIILECREKKQKAICFVTGVPGAGKTLIGLRTAIDQFDKGEKAVYLSGNYPLVTVLQEALARDYVRRSKEACQIDKTANRPCTKAEARSEVKAFIQMIHHYRDLYLEGMKVENGELIEIPGYFKSHTDKAYIPTEHVAIFDEAQRAWTREALTDFMNRKKNFPNFPYSESYYLMSCMDRQTDWGLVICLVGGGQEINKGEAGIAAWFDALKDDKYKDWHIYVSDRLTDEEYSGGRLKDILPHENNNAYSVFSQDKGLGLFKNEKDLSSRFHIVPELHLPISMRSFRAENVSMFVHQLLDLDKGGAAVTLKKLDKYPIVLTRSLDEAKKWMRSKARGTERFGILASSKAERLKAISINVRYKPDFVHWFLDDDSDIRSSNVLEDSLTEFEVQGLEIDWACIAWDADLRLNESHSKWDHYQLMGGSKWQKINKLENQNYQINAYRVLLTRARQGMVIVVPYGDTSVPPDSTRKPEWYDGIYNYLKDIGIKEI
ncbi:MAG: DUF2075 domain-containing protein [Prevotella sp.]|nr:DUF2075 domain-containing protein [Prevotella sp.]